MLFKKPNDIPHLAEVDRRHGRDDVLVVAGGNPGITRGIEELVAINRHPVGDDIGRRPDRLGKGGRGGGNGEQ